MAFAPDSLVRHAEHGPGRVIRDDGELVVVEFDGGHIQRVRANALAAVDELTARLEAGRWDPPLPTVLRAAALSIRSVNDRWGVFSPTRIALLPHQLWVCRKVLERWPARWLVADDVGLGKTVEAGLVIDPLVTSGRVRRLLIISPASLVAQWQVRMRTMFGLRLAQYTPETDTESADFWGTHSRVIASLQTLRRDTTGRWRRLVESPPWDLVVVDEAHHLNVEENGRTLAYRLLDEMQENRRIRSMVFFTGTPHRGKTFGFFGLMRLLRPDLFDPRQPHDTQLPRLREAMIRNNKRQVTDMSGERIFTPVSVASETYHYSPEEQTFYDRLSVYIATGRAFAGGLGSAGQRRAMLVLITMQKLASSSIAAVSRALRTRLERMRGLSRRASAVREEAARMVARLRELEELHGQDDEETIDARAALEELVATHVDPETFNPDEIPAIEELLDLAGAVKHETKIERLLDLLGTRFSGRSVLLFTEYKATQALVLSALQRRFGNGCATFINGDGAVGGVADATGQVRTLRADRMVAARDFNDGRVRFLVSTEAAGEGIDLQRSCHTLCHVDLPWNPMRLHQRVGRVSRYGQRYPVDVFLFMNPATVEGQIWERLFEKLERITEAFRNSMDDPEDMLQAVLGLATPGLFEGMFADAPQGADPATLKHWFDARASTFGGSDAIQYVERVFGSVARFDFGSVTGDLPRVDLPDLVPFFRAALAHQGRRPEVIENVVAFNTPDTWAAADTLLPQAAKLRFSRDDAVEGTLAGVGNAFVELALDGALGSTEAVTRVQGLGAPLAVVSVEERLSGATGVVRRVVFGVERAGDGWSISTDWQTLGRINELLAQPYALARSKESDLPGSVEAAGFAREALAEVRRQLPMLKVPMEAPEVGLNIVLWPGEPGDAKFRSAPSEA